VIRRDRRLADALAERLETQGISASASGDPEAEELAALEDVAARLVAMARPDPMAAVDPGVRRAVLARSAVARRAHRRMRIARALVTTAGAAVLTLGTVFAGPANVAEAVSGAVGSVVSAVRVHFGEPLPIDGTWPIDHAPDRTDGSFGSPSPLPPASPDPSPVHGPATQPPAAVTPPPVPASPSPTVLPTVPPVPTTPGPPSDSPGPPSEPPVPSLPPQASPDPPAPPVRP
jgi:hypothetical protein